MKKIRKMKFVLISILFISCSAGNDEPLRAITELKKFNPVVAESKFKKIESVNRENLIGERTMIASFFTVIKEQIVTTFQLEGKKYNIKKDGSLIIDNTASGFDNFSCSWNLESNNKVFSYNNEWYNVRVKGDTMEWIKQVDEDYMYFVLVK